MNVIYKKISDKNCAGIQYGFYTVHEKYEPLHYHDELEILYYLNGEGSVLIDGKRQKLPKKQVLVIRPGQVHNATYSNSSAMYLCIHIDLSFMEEYVPDIPMYQIACCPDQISQEDFPKYRELCVLFEQLTRRYMRNAPMFLLDATGLILQIFAMLLQDFSEKELLEPKGRDVLSRKRIREALLYTEEHHMEQIALEDVASLLGLGREYFCRFFKKNMGMSYGKYLNEVRISKIHHDLLHTDEPVASLMEKHGFLNAKLFYDTFRDIYGCKPLQIRKNGA